MAKKKIDLLEIHLEKVAGIGTFWEEEFKGTIIHSIMSSYKTEIIRDFTIVDIIVPNTGKYDSTDKILVKWAKRFQPLTKEELEEKWGRTDV